MRFKLRTDLRASIAVLILSATFSLGLTGCTAESTKQVVSEISAQIPVAQAAVTAGSIYASVIDPGAAILISTATASVNAALVQIKNLCQAYAQSADPTVLASINTALNTVINQDASALLDAAKISDANSRTVALASLGTFQVALQLLYGIVQKGQTKQQVQATAAMRTFKLEQIAPYLPRQDVEMATGRTFQVAIAYETAQGF